MAKKYITDEIGEEYKAWKPGDIIFLSAPTGSGKTTFILDTLLRHCTVTKKRILYLVNRTTLKEQIDKFLHDEVSPECRLYIDVQLYHNIENKVLDLKYSYIETEYYKGYKDALSDNEIAYKEEKYPDLAYKYWGDESGGEMQNCLAAYKKYDLVICDECHYFLSDSTFNTNTIVSYSAIQRLFRDKIRIFMSATIERIKEVILDDDKNLENVCSKFYWLTDCGTYRLGENLNRDTFSYSADRNYDYIDIKTVGSYEEIPELVVDGKDKWLIFVDSIDKGKWLKKKIEEKCTEMKKSKSLIFLTSKYLYDMDATDEMKNITTTGKQSADIVIATKVIDNGVSFDDQSLRNIIAITDTETEFIQMLGRKRADDQKTTVYLFKYSKEHFSKRYRIVDKTFEFAFEYWREICDNFQYWVDSWEIKRRKYIENRFQDTHEKNCIKEIESYKSINEFEWNFIKSKHKSLLQEAHKKRETYEKLRTCFFVYDGMLVFNVLSLLQLLWLRIVYKEMIRKFDVHGEDAFYIEQLNWLQKPID